MTIITGFRVIDVRFPTSRTLDGSDATNLDPDYSAAYVIFHTDCPGLSGHGLTFTIGRGNEICCAALRALAVRLVGLELDWIRENPARFWRFVVHDDSQLRWIGPEKGAVHLAAGAIVNAIWDLWSKHERVPVWQLIAQMTPQELLRLVDFRYISDCVTPKEALQIFERAVAGKDARLARLKRSGYPCYTTSAGWLGYDDARLRAGCEAAVAQGYRHLKLKVGRNLDDDVRRLHIAREVLGEHRFLMIDANQVWEVPEAIAWLQQLRFASPFFIEEPTSPDDIEGHRQIRRAIAPMKVATGEMCQNRILFKQFMSRHAIDIVQIDACRLGGLNEVLAVLLLAAKFRLPVWPHAGGVGLCEYVQHLSIIDYLCVSAEIEGRVIEYVDHLHEHFVHPCVVRDAAYQVPQTPGFSIEMKADSLARYRISA